jgi:xanthine dehydrogenase accessory factor
MIFWEHILEKLQDDQKVYLLTVIENFGSSPGRKGFKMMVALDGFIFGSIGGGVMEFTLVEEAQRLLLKEVSPNYIKKQIHKGHVENGSGMICSGEQTVAFQCLDSDDIPAIENILDCLKNGEKGTLRLTIDGFNFSDKRLENQFEYEIMSEEDWSFEEHIGFRETLYIVGGGHVGMAVSELFVRLGFYVIVFDNREKLNTLEGNKFAHQKLVVDYNNIQKYVLSGHNNYVVIMTNTFNDDKLVVRNLVMVDYKFIGVLGSKAKVKTMMKDLRKEGYSQEVLETVYAPIGIRIKSETPEEIAVSIAAQVIEVKNKG